MDAPTNIRAQQTDQSLQLAWEDGLDVGVPYHTIRADCPCASCRNEWTGERILDPATIRPDLRLESMEQVGSYAVRFAWNDGHSSGIYTWEVLRKLAEVVSPHS